MNELAELIRKYEKAKKIETEYDQELFDKFVSPILEISDEKEQHDELVEIICKLPMCYTRHRVLEILFTLKEKLGIKTK